MKSRLLGAVCTVVLTFVTASANAGLIGRLETSPGRGVFQAFYDDQLDITWLADSNAAVGSAFDDGFSATDGRMTWVSATEWAASLNINGVTGWRLPNMDINGDDNIVDCSDVTQAVCMDNEYGHLYFYGAGTTLGDGLMSNQAPFSNVQNLPYWSGTENASDSASAWIFSFGGIMGAASKSTSELFAWAVRSGDVGPPTPSSAFVVSVDDPSFKFNATADPTGVIGAIYQNGRQWDLEGYNHSAFILGSPVIPIDESQIRLSAVDWSASPAWNWSLTLRAHYNGTPFSLDLYSLDPPVQSVLDTGIFPSLSLLNDLEWRVGSAHSHGIPVEGPVTSDFENGRLVPVQFDPAPLTETLIDINGTIKTVDGTDICAMVLASGQFMFSCNPVGVFSLTGLPSENNGTVKRQIYADGFLPKVDILTISTNEAVVMSRSGTCPSYNTPYDPGVFPDSAGKRIDISGQVLLQNSQTPICAMVLANGQYMFSCDGPGSYALNIPLDGTGQFKLQVYADGFAPSIRTFDEFKTTNIVRMARAVECQ